MRSHWDACAPLVIYCFTIKLNSSFVEELLNDTLNLTLHYLVINLQFLTNSDQLQLLRAIMYDAFNTSWNPYFQFLFLLQNDVFANKSRRYSKGEYDES